MSGSLGLAEHLPKFQAEAETLERRLHALRSIIAGIQVAEGLEVTVAAPLIEPPPRYAVVGNAPRGIYAILAVMEEHPDRIWKLSEIKRVLIGRRWTPSAKAVDASVKRLLQRGWVRNPRYGFYMLARRGDAFDTGHGAAVTTKEVGSA